MCPGKSTVQLREAKEVRYSLALAYPSLEGDSRRHQAVTLAAGKGGKGMGE